MSLAFKICILFSVLFFCTYCLFLYFFKHGNRVFCFRSYFYKNLRLDFYLSTKFQIENIFGYFSWFFDIFFCEINVLNFRYFDFLDFWHLRSRFLFLKYFFLIPREVRDLTLKFGAKILKTHLSAIFWITTILFSILLKLGLGFCFALPIESWLNPKVLGILDNPKGMTTHSYRPSLVLKAVFHSSPG